VNVRADGAPRRIDTHHHVVPPDYAAWLRRRGVEAGGLPIPDWSPEAALALMDERGVESAILSVSTPGMHLGDDTEARALARDVNDTQRASIDRGAAEPLFPRLKRRSLP
jgi:predicted TIM-barrel fold metal-dependent hydrolase